MNIRQIIGDIIGWLLIRFYHDPLKDSFSNKILSIYYHNPSKRVFAETIDFLREHGYRFISTSELYDILVNNKKLESKTALITLDDAWVDNINNVIPYAYQHNIPITVFAAIQPLSDGVLWLKYFRSESLILSLKNKFPHIDLSKPKLIGTTDRDTILIEMKQRVQYDREIMSMDNLLYISKYDNVTIGSHTLSHPILPNCNQEKLFYELRDSKEQLEVDLNKKIISLAYPNGDYNLKIINECKNAGYKLAFTTEQKILDVTNGSPFALPRYCVPDKYGKFESIARGIGVWAKFFKK